MKTDDPYLADAVNRQVDLASYALGGLEVDQQICALILRQALLNYGRLQGVDFAMNDRTAAIKAPSLDHEVDWNNFAAMENHLDNLSSIANSAASPNENYLRYLIMLAGGLAKQIRMTARRERWRVFQAKLVLFQRYAFSPLGSVSILVFLGLATLLIFWSIPPKRWQADYFNNTSFEGDPVSIQYSSLNFNWAYGSPHSAVPNDNFSARFQSCLHLQADTEVTFELASDDGSRLIINGEQVIDNYRHQPRHLVSEVVTMPKGLAHLVVEYFEAGGLAELSFTMREASTRKVIQPFLPKTNQSGKLVCK